MGGELGTPHQLVILHKMFLHVAERGQKEAEYMVDWGCWGSALEPDPEAGHSAMELVVYWTSHKENPRHLSECLSATQATRIPSCGDRLRREMIQDILSSLKDQLHRCRYPATAREDLEPQEGDGLNQMDGDYMRKLLGQPIKGCWTLLRHFKGNIERLSQRVRDRS